MGSGFAPKNNKYVATNITLKRYAVKVVGDFEQVILNNLYFNCHESFSPDFKPHLITCFHAGTIDDEGNRVPFGGLPDLFYYNKETAKFSYVSVSVGGFTHRDGGDTDYLFAGVCEKF